MVVQASQPAMTCQNNNMMDRKLSRKKNKLTEHLIMIENESLCICNLQGQHNEMK
jgi:hypothetical protein